MVTSRDSIDWSHHVLACVALQQSTSKLYCYAYAYVG
jgi:hypothetical protein